jgi:hypothetical protein
VCWSIDDLLGGARFDPYIHSENLRNREFDKAIAQCSRFLGILKNNASVVEFINCVSQKNGSK